MPTLTTTAAVAGLRSSVRRSGALQARVVLQLDRLLDVGRSRTWPNVVAVLGRARRTRISVDVFDTVLTRRLLGDEALWWLTAQSLVAVGGWSGTAADFVVARAAAAEAAPDDDLRGIYRAAALAAGLTCADGAEVESRWEAELAIPVPGAAEGLSSLRAAGHAITFVSDMHLAREAVWTSLAGHGLAEDADDLLVSTDVGAAKSAGTLFPLLVSGSAAPTWHVGNDLWSDVAMAELAGVRALPLRVAEATRLELLGAGPAGSVGAALAGAARQVRVSSSSQSSEAAALVEVGADVAGVCLGAFLLWAREESESAGVQRLCFLARDGELPLRMAEAMPGDHWDGVQLTYVHGSRRLWSAASVAVVGVDAWLAAGTGDEDGFLRQNQHAIPWGSLLSRALLLPVDVAEHDGLAALPFDQPLPEELADAWDDVLADERSRTLLLERGTVQFAHLRELLQADGIGRTRVGLLDVGWRGQLAWQVSAVLREVTGHEPVHLHFGGVGVSGGVDADIRRFAVDDSKAPLPFHDFVSCVETLTASGAARARATHRSHDGDVRLVFDEALPHMDTQQRRLLWGSAVQVAELLPSRGELIRWGLHLDGLGEVVADVLSAFWLCPTSSHGRAGAQLSSEVDDAGHSVLPVARPYRMSELVGRAASCRTWRQGSLAITPARTRPLVRWALQQRDRRTGR